MAARVAKTGQHHALIGPEQEDIGKTFPQHHCRLRHNTRRRRAQLELTAGEHAGADHGRRRQIDINQAVAGLQVDSVARYRWTDSHATQDRIPAAQASAAGRNKSIHGEG